MGFEQRIKAKNFIDKLKKIRVEKLSTKKLCSVVSVPSLVTYFRFVLLLLRQCDNTLALHLSHDIVETMMQYWKVYAHLWIPVLGYLANVERSSLKLSESDVDNEVDDVVPAVMCTHSLRRPPLFKFTLIAYNGLSHLWESEGITRVHSRTPICDTVGL